MRTMFVLKFQHDNDDDDDDVDANYYDCYFVSYAVQKKSTLDDKALRMLFFKFLSDFVQNLICGCESYM